MNKYKGKSKNPLDLAKEILLKGGYTCVLCSDSEELHSTLRGVRPLIDFLESKKDFRGFCAADKTIGMGAAHLYVLLGVRSVWANVMSSPARSLLQSHGIDASCVDEVPFIINRLGTGPCPIESAVTGVASSTEALKIITETLKRL